jgi:hypothetical protein
MEAKTMAGKRKKQSADLHKRAEGNLGQQEANIEKEKASDLAHMGEKTGESGENEKDKRRSA